VAIPRERSVLWQIASPSSAAEADAQAWGRAVATRFEVAGGEIVARAGTSVAASFDPMELDDAIDLALGVLADAGEARGLEIACALALGDLLGESGAQTGTAIDRALALAAHAQRGELVLDDAAHARAQDTHLFTRGLRAGPVTGHVVDGNTPHKRTCRRALATLREAPGPRGAFEHLCALASQPGQRRIVLRSAQPHAALDWLERLARELKPDLVLHVGRRAAALQPLGGLQLALLRAGDAADAVLDGRRRELVALLRTGESIARSDAVDVLRALLARGGRQRTLVVLDRVRELDAPTLTLLIEAFGDPECDALLLVIADDNALPAVLTRAGLGEEVVLEPLSLPERARVAETVLGLPQGSDVARRVALLGGESAQGVVEAARTLICSGDLVIQDGAFDWRTRPRLPSLPIPIDALLTERAAGLDAPARRVLEVACVAPQGMARDALVKLAILDGLSADAAAQGIEQLHGEGWLGERPLLPLEHAIRSAVRNGMPPARAAELHRFVADVLKADGPAPGPAFGRALLAHHLAEGGREREAAAAMLDAAQAAIDAGFERTAVRLAALALKLDASRENRDRARRLARNVDSIVPISSRPPLHRRSSAPAPAVEPARIEEPPEPRQLAASAVRAAIRAIVRGDVESAESLVDTAVAGGWGRAAAQRLWSIAQLKKGDVPAAVRALKQARAPQAAPAARNREAITAALILLESGEPIEAVRAALEGLAGCRRASDAGGERAALLVLCACYRMLGREPEALHFESAAATPA
jgi:hypothetical protein